MAVAVATAAFVGATAVRRGWLDTTYNARRALAATDSVLASPGRTTMALLSAEHALGIAEVAWLGLVAEISGNSDPLRLEQRAYVTTDLDPLYELVYWAAAITLSGIYETDAADRVIKRGTEARPDVWRFWFLLGYHAYFVRGEPAQASEYWREASMREDAPRYTAALASRALFHAGSEASAEKMLEEMIPLLPESQREDAKMRLDIQRSEYRFRRFDEACERFLAEQGRYPQHAEELRVQGYIDEPPRDLLDSPIEFDEGKCVSRSELVFMREAEAAERVGMMKKVSEKRRQDDHAPSDHGP